MTFLPFALALAGVLIITSAVQESSPPGVICEDNYALCTSARCQPDPSDSTKTICDCKVFKGKSFGQIPCDKRKSKVDDKGIQHVISTYSLESYTEQKTMTCPSGTPWSYCLDRPCTVDPIDPSKAICSCDVKYSGSFVTLGGNCDTSTCKTSYWSGAAGSDTTAAMDYLVKALGMEKVPDNFCPDTK